MEELTFKEFFAKSSAILEKYRSNLAHLRSLKEQIEKKFFIPAEMVEHFYANKSEYYTWQESQDSIISLEEAHNELVSNMMDALGDPEVYQYYLKDKRIPVLVYPDEDDDEDDEDDENSEEEDIDSDKLADQLAKEIVDEITKEKKDKDKD